MDYMESFTGTNTSEGLYNDTATFVFQDNITMTTWAPNSTTAIPSTFERLSKAYQQIHGYFAVCVCVFGIISNILNIIVLTRRHMISPTNMILTALAIADILTMSTYVVMATYLYILNEPIFTKPHCHSKQWVYFLMFHTLFIITCHMMAMWLTVTLAVFRYIFVCQHQKAMTMCSMQRAKISVGIVFVVTFVSCLPYLFMYKAKLVDERPNCYVVDPSDFASSNPMYGNFVNWLYGVVIKILPCVVLAYLSTLLIIAMQKAKKRRARLLNNISRVLEHDTASEHNRTTMMLVAVVMCFIVTETPQGLLAWISAVERNFFDDVYVHLGDLMDILVLINSAVNFILYCIMSQQFRNTFKSLFVSKHLPPFFRRVKHHTNGGDYSMVHTETTLV
ncbi:G-protein coupled receptor [Biomphalaria pfeifferi]|uniref:G-protein coupled receptor n=1 Tax=Biomphalaria pfeifferi TaxID=112525 RepID=A0AAD8BXA6_BIOPF|nr:G-protein coupled receptor [Biomphalaria pfeifferi]